MLDVVFMQGKRQAVDEPSEGPSEAVPVRRVPPPPTPSAASLVMRTESHPWLKWPGCSNAKKIELNNKLATLQEKTICQPRIMDWSVCVELGVSEELDQMFLTRYTDFDGTLEIPVWNRAFDVRENSYRELCLEFYSSLHIGEIPRLQHTIYKAPLISFRLGGREHKVTITQFGMFTGLYTRAEEGNERFMSGYNLRCEWNSDEFSEDIHQRWFELTGIHRHTSTSKIKEVRSPILRVIHKLITYSFLHRSSQQDKVYMDDLWLLHMFSRRDPTKFVNVPWVLACYMEEKGKGRQHDSPMLCGHFVTRIAKSLGLASNANIRLCSPFIPWRKLTKRDLQTSGLLAPGGNRLIGEEAAPPPLQQEPQQEAPRRGRGSMSDAIFQMSEQMSRMSGQMDVMGRQVERIDRNVVGIGNYVDYHVNRYHPSWEAAAQHYHTSSSSASMWFPYAPPMMFPPSPPREEPEQGREEQESEEEGGDGEED